MKKVISLMIAVAVLMLVAGEVLAQNTVLVCYRWQNITVNALPGGICTPIQFNEVYKLNIKKHSSLSTTAEEHAFGHPKQVVYSVHGKHVGVCGRLPEPLPPTVRTVVGTLVTTVKGTRPSTTEGQARMGLETYSTTGCPEWCRDVEISCKSTGDGFPPASWHCYGMNKWGNEFEFDLVKVSETVDKDCCSFEDGGPVTQGEGPASGLNAGQTP